MAKILMITGDRSVAQGKRGAFYNTLEEFHKYWERIDVICPKIKYQKSNIKNIFGNVFIYPSPWPIVFQPWFILRKGYSLFKKHSFQFITVHEYPPFYNGLGARWLHGATKVSYLIEIHHIPGFPKAANFKEQLYIKLAKFYLKYDCRKAKAVRVVNQNQLVNFLTRFGIPGAKIIFIPSLYLDLNIFKPSGEPKKYDVIFVGRLAENKGVNILIEALAKLLVRAVIVGDGPLRKRLKNKIEKFGISDRVKLYGWAKDQAEVAGLISQSRILVMPSYNEGNPRVVLEAMACGVPVIATPVGIVPDIIENGKNGQIVCWDAEDIARKIQDLLADSTSQMAYGNAGLEIARQFDKKTTIKNYADRIKEIINR